LNDKQQRVFEWLSKDLNLPVFADAYKGAVSLLDQKSAGHISFVAHAGRDLMNGLANTVAGIRPGRVHYQGHIDKLQDEWQSEWQLDGELSAEATETGHVIPFGVCQSITSLIEDHKSGRLRSSEADGIFFSTFLDYTDKEKIPHNFLSEWKATKKWFLGHAHLREKSFRDETNTNLIQHFECLDGYLFIAASSQYERLKTLDEILDSANH
jgi:hypothetical protein